MSETRHVPPAPPATRLAVGAALAVLVVACGAGLGGSAAAPLSGVLEGVALAVLAGWWLAPRVTAAWGAETDRLAQAQARALAVRLCGDARRVCLGAVVGWPALLAAAGLAESGDGLVALGLAALGGLAGVAVVAVVAVACRRGGTDVASAAARRLRRRRRLGRVRCAARAMVASLTARCPTPWAPPAAVGALTAHPVCCAPARAPIAAHAPPAAVAAVCAACRGRP